ncbi:hypothetical protein SCOCK_210017 [Actinacidiphila cocklensis]|uniref:Uncharacterized protein n=1 Tax=Actinacidiphila cocklensis TaxID=887465 RepID=A0A9W4DQ03_9ACTN|nr:hypothetical protein SCOCK_210017 [Actinacidiphila cocklensis]
MAESLSHGAQHQEIVPEPVHRGGLGRHAGPGAAEEPQPVAGGHVDAGYRARAPRDLDLDDVRAGGHECHTVLPPPEASHALAVHVDLVAAQLRVGVRLVAEHQDLGLALMFNWQQCRRRVGSSSRGRAAFPAGRATGHVSVIVPGVLRQDEARSAQEYQRDLAQTSAEEDHKSPKGHGERDRILRAGTTVLGQPRTPQQQQRHTAQANGIEQGTLCEPALGRRSGEPGQDRRRRVRRGIAPVACHLHPGTGGEPANGGTARERSPRDHVRTNSLCREMMAWVRWVGQVHECR